MSTYTVREKGKNGTVEVMPDRIVHTEKRLIGKDDVQTIPLRSVTSVQYNRKTLGTNVVTIQAGAKEFEWKTSKAESMVEELNAYLFTIDRGGHEH